MNKKIISVISLLAATAIGCTSTPTFQEGEDAEVTYDGLTRMDGTIMDAVWARTDIDLTEYSKVMFEGVGIEFREVSGPYSGRAGSTSVARRSSQSEFALHEDTRALFEEAITGAFREEMGQSEVFEIVEEAGPDVLLIRGGLLDVVSRVPPETIGRSRVWISSVGEATLILEIRSSMSNSIYVRAADRRAMDSNVARESNSATNRAEVRRLGRRWGRQLRDGLDTLLTDGLKRE